VGSFIPAMTITGAGHSNIFSASTSTSTATVVSAIRTYANKQYFFRNLTFNMPSNANTDASDWTAPANSSTYKWSYIYIRPSDNKFFISNNAPATGENYRFIGGSLCLYLFPAWTSSAVILNFQLTNSEYSVLQPSNARSTFRTSDTGIGLFVDWGGGNRTTGVANVSANIPVTATQVYAGFRYSLGIRSDSGATGYYSASAEIQNKSGTWTTAYVEDGWLYIKTPSVGGGFFLRRISPPVDLTLSTSTLNFTAVRLSWSTEFGTNDADTGAGIWMKGFNDGNIF